MDDIYAGDTGERALISIGGTDFRICEPYPFVKETSKIWYSHKFKGPGVCYEIGVSIKRGDIVWYNGPFPCGVPDINIFRASMRGLLSPCEMVIADQGYSGNTKVLCPLKSNGYIHRRAMSKIRARHETVNSRFKSFGCLKQIFRHSRDTHHLVTKATLALTQIDICNGHPLFQVTGYNDPIFV